MDADAFAMRFDRGIDRWLRLMDVRDANLLVTRDYLRDRLRSPINFGAC